MASKATPLSFQLLLMGSIWSVKSSKVKLLKAVCTDRTAVGTMPHSTPIAEMMGKATVSEHLPTHDMSWMLAIRFMCEFLLLRVKMERRTGLEPATTSLEGWGSTN